MRVPYSRSSVPAPAAARRAEAACRAEAGQPGELQAVSLTSALQRGMSPRQEGTEKQAPLLCSPGLRLTSDPAAKTRRGVHGASSPSP